MKPKKSDATATVESVLGKPPADRYVLRLYVTGMTQRSAEAVVNLKNVCREYLEGRYDLEVIDLQKHPQLAGDEQVFAAPLLVKKLPLPMRRLIGNLSNRERVLFGLDLRPEGEGAA